MLSDLFPLDVELLGANQVRSLYFLLPLLLLGSVFSFLKA